MGEKREEKPILFEVKIYQDGEVIGYGKSDKRIRGVSLAIEDAYDNYTYRREYEIPAKYQK